MALKIYKPERGYDLVSNIYDDTKWNSFWKANESPFVNEWLHKLERGLGLDAGAGTGMYANNIVASGHDIVELDISAKMLLINKKKHSTIPNHRLLYVKARIDRKIFADEFFDWILCTRVLSHCKNLEKQIKNFNSYLKKGGECFISDIHPEHEYLSTGFRINENKKISIETHKHSLKSYKEIIKNNGFKIIAFKEIGHKQLLEKPENLGSKSFTLNSSNKIFFFFIIKKI